MRRIRLATAAIAATLVACGGGGNGTVGASSDPALEARVDAVAFRALEEAPLSSLSIAVGRGDGTVLSKGYGFADVATDVPATPETVYRMGSIAKTFTAAAIMRLAEDGELSLDDPAARYLPADMPIDPAITVEQLVMHTSGLANLGRMPGFEETQGIGMTRDEVVDWVVSQPLEFEPGTEWSYSNSGYLVASLVIEGASRRPSADYITDEVIEAAGLDATGYCLDDRRPAGTAGYHLVDGGWGRVARLGRAWSFVEAPPANMAIVSLGGPTCSTAEDLVRWLEALREGDVVPTSAYRRMTEPVALPDGTAPYGIGLQLREEFAHTTIGHTGLINGFMSLVRYFPEEDVTIAFLSNTAPPEPPEVLWSLLVDAVFGG